MGSFQTHVIYFHKISNGMVQDLTTPKASEYTLDITVRHAFELLRDDLGAHLMHGAASTVGSDRAPSYRALSFCSGLDMEDKRNA